MKKMLFIALVSLSVTLIDCQNKDIRITDPSSDESKKLVTTGKQISGELLKSLQTELQAAIKEGGFENAINVCNLKAIPITEIVRKNTESDVIIKRTSRKYRNPLNAPDPAETAALNHYHKLIDAGEKLPGYLTQKVRESGKTYYYYHQPITTGGLCLSCHGTQSMLALEVSDRIRELYPYDLAYDYEEGDFRGLVSIKFLNLN
jgi:hypothetical protein